MNFILLQTFTNYMDAHIVMGRLQSQDINCWLKDEHISGLIVDPLLTNLIGGIKLMVAENQVEKATQILNEAPEENED